MVLATATTKILMAKSSNVIFFLEKIQKFSRNTRSSFEPMDLIGMTDKYVLLIKELGKEKIFMICLIFEF